MKNKVITIIFLLFSIAVVNGQCKKCDIEQLLSIHEKMDSLESSEIVKFLCTFDKSCNNNLEFSEWSNELLFKVVHRYTNEYFKIITSDKITNQEAIFKEFDSPLLEEDFQTLYDKIKNVDSPTKWKTRYLESIIGSAKREGKIIKK